MYGHLDKINLFDELSWWEKRNLEVDGMAVEYRKEFEATRHLIAPNPRFFNELAALYVADTNSPVLILSSSRSVSPCPVSAHAGGTKALSPPKPSLRSPGTSLDAPSTGLFCVKSPTDLDMQFYKIAITGLSTVAIEQYDYCYRAIQRLWVICCRAIQLLLSSNGS